LTNGKCQDCEEYFHVDDDQRECVQESCEEDSQILLTTGFCETCGDYTHSDIDNKACVTDSCDVDREIVGVDG
jgi:hypothetical protein